MAFTPSTLSVIVQPIGGEGMRFVSYRTDDEQAMVTGSGYFEKGTQFGLRPHDLIFVSPLMNGFDPYILVVDAIDGEDVTGSINAEEMPASVYDPQGVGADAFDQDNMTDGTTNKNYTATEKTKLTGIEAGADVTDATNVAAAGATMNTDTDVSGNAWVAKSTDTVADADKDKLAATVGYANRDGRVDDAAVATPATPSAGISAEKLKFLASGTSATALDVNTRLGFVVYAKDFGAKGDGKTVSDAAITASDTTLTSATAAFTADDVGKYIEVTGAGAAGAVLVSTIASYTSATSVELTDAAGTTVSGASCTYGTDDADAIQAALSNELTQKTRRKVKLSAGVYLLGSTITISSIDSGIEGAGPQLPSVLKAFHSDGPVLKIQADFQTVKQLSVSATPARENGGNGTTAAPNVGILHQAAVSLARYVEYADIVCEKQPLNGLQMVGTINFSSLTRVDCSRNGRHGLLLDNGTATGLDTANLVIPGLINIDGFTAYDNDGHGILIGHEDQNNNRCVRVHMRNIELARNAEAAGSRLSAHQMWVFGSEIFVEASGFSGLAQDNTTQTTGGIHIMGQDCYLIGNRFLDMGTAAITVDNPTEFETNNIVIDGVLVTSDTSLDPAVVKVNNPKNVRVFSGSTAAINSLVSVFNTEAIVTTKMIYKATDESRNSTTTLTDDDVLVAAIPFEKQRIPFRAVIIYAGPAAADIKIAFTIPSGASIRWGTASGTRIAADDTVVQQDAILAGGTAMVMGSAATRRIVELVGEVTTNGTAGDLTLQWAQSVSDAGNTTVYGESHMILYY